MNIGFDAKRAFHNFSGLGNYSRLLIHSLSDLFFNNQYFLFTPSYRSHPLHIFAEKDNCNIITPNGINNLFPSSFWRSFTMAKDINIRDIDVFHGLSGELPVSFLKMPKVVTIHDVIFLRYPEYYSTFDRKIYEKKFHHACKIADKIITVSKQTANDCIKYLGANAKKIEIGYQSCDSIFFTPVDADGIKKKYDLPEKYILNVGTIEARKNLLNLVKTLKYIDEDISLVAIGKRTPYTKIVEEYIKDNYLTNRVKLMHNVSFSDFPAIYATAAAFVYSSVFEGFGIPVLEALAVGTPVATSNISSMPEVGGDAAIYFDPYNVEDMADKINLLIHNKDTVNQLYNKREKQLVQFAIKNVAAFTDNIYHSF